MLPWLARAIIYPLQERAMQRPTFPYLRELEASQWLSRGEIEVLQLEKLNRLLKLAVAHSPWHAARIESAGLTAAADAGRVTPDALRQLPTMTKADARAHIEAIVWRSVPGGVFQYNTGGSSGEPLVFYYGRERQAADAAGRIRARRWWGVEPGEREIYLWGAPIELNRTDKVKTLRDRLINQLVLNAFAMSIPRMDQYLHDIKAWRPASVYGYASSLSLLAAHAEARGVALRIPTLRVVCTTGEPLYLHQRELLERVFGVPVANEYGCRDGGFIGHEAPGGQMLMVSESNFVEILDPEGAPVPIGVPGELVLTGLTSATQPFIRYRTGDIVALSAEPDRGGRGLHVIAEVAGRSTDFVVREDGTIMHALAVIYVLRAIDGVAQFKCIQHTPTHMEVLVVPGTAWHDQDGPRIVHGLRARLGESLQVDLKLQQEILPEVSGKHRYVVSHVKLPENLGATLANAS
jgi:phenylacetate-CoA ligase